MAMTPAHMRELLINTGARYEPPTPEELAAAAFIEDWSLLDVGDEDDMPAVIGIVSGHPHDFVADGSLHVGAEAFAMDADLRWVRTLGRLYRLGKPAEGSDDE